MRLTILGGGGFRVPLVYEALLSGRGGGPVDEVALYDVDERRLAAIEHVLRQLAGGAPRAPRVTVARDLSTALEGAAFVFCAVRVGGLAGRAVDEHLARAEGLVAQETSGTGGVGYGLRTVPVALDIAARIARTAPDAWVVNFTNPAGMVTEAMSRVLGDRVIGVCDTPSALCRRAARVLGADPERAWFDYAGLNHLGWLRGVSVDGRDLMPALLADDAAVESLEEGRLFGATWLRAMRAVPNEYLFYYDFAGEAAHAAQEGVATRGEFLLRQQRDFYDAVEADPSRALAAWRHALRERDATYMSEERAASGAGPREREDLEEGGYETVALALMEAIATGSRTILILNVRNRSALPGLPADAVVEVPCVVDGNGARPVAMGSLGEHESGLVQRVKAVERTTIDAALTGSRTLALRALAGHPLSGSVGAAERILDGYLARFPDLAELFQVSRG